MSGSSDECLRIWNLATGECTAELNGHTDFVYCIAPLPDGQIVSGSHGGDKSLALRIWNMVSGKCTAELNGRTGNIISVSTLPNGQIVSGSTGRYGIISVTGLLLATVT